VAQSTRVLGLFLDVFEQQQVLEIFSYKRVVDVLGLVFGLFLALFR